MSLRAKLSNYLLAFGHNGGPRRYYLFDLKNLLFQMLLFTPLLRWADGVGMCNIFTLSKGERLNPNIEGDVHIIKCTN